MDLVDEHVRHENGHDLEAIMATFGTSARYDDAPWNAHYDGRDEVRAFYAASLLAIPDLHIDVQKRHPAGDAIVLEVVIRGRHLGPWRGLPPTGRTVELPLCAIFTFDENERLAGERIYYDRATVLRQLGVFHEPERPVGRVTTALMHPVTMARIVGRVLGPSRHRRPP
jgi:steroid delta-isomerase-like uncharacterized protein